MRLHPAERDERRFLGDVAELPRELNVALSGHHRRLDVHEIAPDGGPRETRDDAGNLLATSKVRVRALVSRRTQNLRDEFARHRGNAVVPSRERERSTRRVYPRRVPGVAGVARGGGVHGGGATERV